MKPTFIHKILLLLICLWLPLQGAMAAMMGPCDGNPVTADMRVAGDSSTPNPCCDPSQNGLLGSCAHCAQCNLCSSPSILAEQTGTGLMPAQNCPSYRAATHLEILFSLPFRPPIAA